MTTFLLKIPNIVQNIKIAPPRHRTTTPPPRRPAAPCRKNGTKNHAKKTAQAWSSFAWSFNVVAHGRHKKRTTAWSFFWWCAIMLMPALNQQSSRPCLLGRRRCGLVLQGFRQLPAARLSSVCELKLLGLSSRILRPLREFR